MNLVANPLGAYKGGYRQDLDNEPMLIARCVATGSNGQRYDYETETLIACDIADSLTVGANQTTGFVGDDVAHSLRADGFDASEDGTDRGTPLVAIPLQYAEQLGREKRQNGIGLGDPGDPMFTLEARQPHGVAVDTQPFNIIGCGQKGRNHAYATETSGCLQHKGLAATGNEAGTLMQSGMSVRRLTPRECERLQGFPDDYTAITYRGRPAADGPRYRALGNSMAVPVMRWIGERIASIETFLPS